MVPAGPCDPVEVRVGLEFLQEHGFETVPAPNLASRTSYVAGSDDERLAGVLALLDAGVGALLAARGDHSSGAAVARLPRRGLPGNDSEADHLSSPIWPCSG